LFIYLGIVPTETEVSLMNKAMAKSEKGPGNAVFDMTRKGK